MRILRTLKERSEMTSYGQGKSGKQYLLFSANGGKPEVVEHTKTNASVHLIGPKELAFAPDTGSEKRPATRTKQ